MANRHFNYEPGASATLNGFNDSASVTDIQTGQFDKNGNAFSVVTCLGASIGGKPVSITIPGSITKPTSQEVAAQLGHMKFYKAKFKNLVLEFRASEYNTLKIVGSADAVDFIAPPAAPGTDNTTKN